MNSQSGATGEARSLLRDALKVTSEPSTANRFEPFHCEHRLSACLLAADQ
jgi:hypothetical protein